MDALGPYYTIAILFQKLCAWQILPIIYHKNGPFYTSEFCINGWKRKSFTALHGQNTVSSFWNSEIHYTLQLDFVKLKSPWGLAVD